MTKLVGVGTVISVGHNSPEGIAHGHSYEIIAWFRFGSDARSLLRHLEVVTKPLDHTILPDELRLAENLAEHIAGDLPGCIEVEVNRPLERIYARAIADTHAKRGDVKQAPSVMSGGGAEGNRTEATALYSLKDVG